MDERHKNSRSIVHFDSLGSFEVLEDALTRVIAGGVVQAGTSDGPQGDRVCGDAFCGSVNGVCHSGSNLRCPSPGQPGEVNGLC